VFAFKLLYEDSENAAYTQEKDAAVSFHFFFIVFNPRTRNQNY
jgi:hypothetical protein